MSELELLDHLSQYGDWALEDAEDGDIGYYAYADGGYLPNCYATAEEALEAIRAYFEDEE
ncbi:hypothetical protein ULT26_004311 [Salmonella enterica]|nr:hypothetical protein [Salmonella enterica]